MLNIEHTFLIEHQLLFNLYNNFGYELIRRNKYKNFSLFLEFRKINQPIIKKIVNVNTKNDLLLYIDQMKNLSKSINIYIENNLNKEFYIWPCSVHSCTLFLFGLKYNKFNGILDNSPNKIGKIIDGYNLPCLSFNDILKSNNKNITIIISGANEYIKELKLDTECEIKFLENF